MTTYKYSHVYDGVLRKFESDNIDRIVIEIEEYYNGIGIVSNRDEIIRSIKRQSRIRIDNSKPRINFYQAVHGASALIKNSVFGSSVSSKEIQRRASICQRCPLRSEVSGCKSCGMGGQITKMTNKYRQKVGSATPIPPEVKNYFCDHCGCALALMVLTKHENFAQESELDQAKRPDICWLKQSSPNFTHE